MSVEFDSSRLTIVDHPLVQHKLHILRDEATGTNQFRALVRELAIFEGYEAMRDFPLEDVEVKTPLETATCKRIAGKKVAIVPILRAWGMWACTATLRRTSRILITVSCHLMWATVPAWSSTPCSPRAGRSSPRLGSCAAPVCAT